MKLNAKQIATATGGVWLAEGFNTTAIIDKCVCRIEDVASNTLYVALDDEGGIHNMSRNINLEFAFKSGARVVIVENPIDDGLLTSAELSGCSVMQVDNLRLSILNIAKYWLGKINAKVVSVYNSKSSHSVVQYLNDNTICSSQVVTSKSQTGIVDIDVALTILEADHETRYIVLDEKCEDAESLRNAYKIANPISSVVVDDMEEKTLFNIVSCLPDNNGTLTIDSSLYNKYKNTFLSRLQPRGIKVVECCMSDKI